MVRYSGRSAPAKGNMPPFKEVMTEEQRWQLVAYIRKTI
jgi:mono/diheme cytochrome c family protein